MRPWHTDLPSDTFIYGSHLECHGELADLSWVSASAKKKSTLGKLLVKLPRRERESAGAGSQGNTGLPCYLANFLVDQTVMLYYKLAPLIWPIFHWTKPRSLHAGSIVKRISGSTHLGYIIRQSQATGLHEQMSKLPEIEYMVCRRRRGRTSHGSCHGSFYLYKMLDFSFWGFAKCTIAPTHFEFKESLSALFAFRLKY